MTISMTSVLRAIVMDAIKKGQLDYLIDKSNTENVTGSVVRFEVKKEIIKEILYNNLMKIDPVGDSFVIEVHPKSDFFEG